MCAKHAAQAAQHRALLGAALASPLKHPSQGLGKARMGNGDHQPYPSDAALLEATEENLPEWLAFAVNYLQTQKLSVAIDVDAHGLDHGSVADLQRPDQPPVQAGPPKSLS